MKEKEQNLPSKNRFLLRNLGKGFALLGAFVAIFLVVKKMGGSAYLEWLEPLYSNPLLVYVIYTFSEIFFGLIPPEVFMAWGLRDGDATYYISTVVLLALISYGAGWLNYGIGRWFRGVIWVRWLIRRYMMKYQKYLHQYGGFLLIVACVTPLPFAAVCLLVGTLQYSSKKFFYYTLFRLLRFAVYALIVWNANKL